MTRLIATRISDETYSKILTKCAGLGCSTYDYLRVLVESDVAEKAQIKQEKSKKELEDEEFEKELETPVKRKSKAEEDAEFEKWLNEPAEK